MPQHNVNDAELVALADMPEGSTVLALDATDGITRRIPTTEFLHESSAPSGSGFAFPLVEFQDNPTEPVFIMDANGGLIFVLEE